MYLFKNSSGEHGNILIVANSVEEAMEEIKSKWFKNYFRYDFSVAIINGTSGLHKVSAED